ncbi:MAG: zinc metalloprotease HtpX [Roseiflexus sp.]|jgi:heat shock protein HtpX|nr:zinc metalloprotease HtpX [Roseiflexus sp.]MBO9366155.1 zinc metalloprotease HtpX [Roseiflexus sp.]MBO9383448.1 zinc metalloprotease HtpX [Roseiflexus sp.]MBO9389233.1 zinc metalloprotease HtpX [Roseiflexus sp.]
MTRLTNVFKTAALLATLTVLLVLVGQWFGGTQGMLIAFLVAVLMNGGAYWFSDKLALSMAGAREVDRYEAPRLHQMVAQLAQRADLPMPRVYLIDSAAPNAFATGRNPRHGAVAVTNGLLRLLNDDEVAAVIAHELGHIRNRDTLISAIAATFAGSVAILADMAQWALLLGGFGRHDDEGEDSGVAGVVGGLLLILVAPIAATLIQLAISRTREFEADAAGAAISGSPLALASALRKIEAWKQQLPLATNPAMANLYIVNPLDGSAIVRLFSTHPPTEERIARLERMAFTRSVLVW